MTIISENLVDSDKIYDVLWESISDALGIEVLRENQAGARPPASDPVVPYATIFLNPGPSLSGSDEERYEDASGVLHVKTVGQRELTLSVNLYRKGALQKMARLQKLLQTRSFRDTVYGLSKAQNFELIIVEALSSQDLSSLIQSNYEERAQMDVSLRLTSSITESLEPIEGVEAEGTIKNEADEVVYDGTININL